ncbi:MAG: SUMF1/EgtB/PvdO family nonheme iron enzyme [Opitutales bacterium]|nr:SUMF1/EgtB/PvdO family nonheme iron enzyme [Opitutales bacterium]
MSNKIKKLKKVQSSHKYYGDSSDGDPVLKKVLLAGVGVLAVAGLGLVAFYFWNKKEPAPKPLPVAEQKTDPAEEARLREEIEALNRSAAQADDSEKRAMGERFYNEGLANYRAGDFAAAEKNFEKSNSYGIREGGKYLIFCQLKNGRFTQAFPKVEKLARDGDEEAILFLADEYLSGDETGTDVPAAVGYLTLLAEKGSKEAQRRLAKIYSAGADGVPADAFLAEKYLRSLASDDEAVAIDLASRLLNGVGVAKNDAAAVALLTEWQEKSSRAAYLLGNCFYDGRGTVKSKKKALDLWQAAAAKGNRDAQEMLERFGDKKVQKANRDENAVVRKQGLLPKHSVIKIPNHPRYLGKYEVTQAQYLAIMGTNPSAFKPSGKKSNAHPVENLSKEDALLFCVKLTRYEAEQGWLPDGYEYSLPTQNDWISSWRASKGLQQQYSNYKQVAWFSETAKGMTHPVGKLSSNPLGFKDMLGNVSELTLDGPCLGGNYAQCGHKHLRCAEGQTNAKKSRSKKVWTSRDKVSVEQGGEHKHRDSCYCTHGASGAACQYAETSRPSDWKMLSLGDFELPAGTRSGRVGFRVELTDRREDFASTILGIPYKSVELPPEL